MIGFEHHWIAWTEKMVSPWAHTSLSKVLTKTKIVASSWYNIPLHCLSKGLLSFLSCLHSPVGGCFTYISHNFLFIISTGSDWALSPLPSLGCYHHVLCCWSMSPFYIIWTHLTLLNSSIKMSKASFSKMPIFTKTTRHCWKDLHLYILQRLLTYDCGLLHQDINYPLIHLNSLVAVL
jgi:hypothetical protein